MTHTKEPIKKKKYDKTLLSEGFCCFGSPKGDFRCHDEEKGLGPSSGTAAVDTAPVDYSCGKNGFSYMKILLPVRTAAAGNALTLL